MKPTKTIWQELKAKKKPFFVQAPMEDATDTVFRQIIAACGTPDLFFTEFTSADGMQSAGRDHVIHRLQFSDVERPIIAQIWGNNPENYFKSAQEISEMGFSGIDINFGCPERSITSKGSCAAMIKTPELAKELFLAAKQGSGGLPVSIKTRIGFSHIATEEWISFVLNLKPAALTVHGRTAKEMSKVPAHWDEIGKAVELRNKLSPETVIVGNGDVESVKQGEELAKLYGVDGIMIGRGLFKNPFVFNPNIDYYTLPFQKKLQLLIKHVNLFDSTWKDTKKFAIMKKYVKIYISGIPDASAVREELMQLTSADQMLAYLSKLPKDLK